ncbi:MAG: hypothetical protein JO071_13130 [Deltaproteobacteria bacterium]|nr:hypothetical protein [Deltaproteobacteria bacterium]
MIDYYSLRMMPLSRLALGSPDPRFAVFYHWNAAACWKVKEADAAVFSWCLC